MKPEIRTPFRDFSSWNGVLHGSGEGFYLTLSSGRNGSQNADDALVRCERL